MYTPPFKTVPPGLREALLAFVTQYRDMNVLANDLHMMGIDLYLEYLHEQREKEREAALLRDEFRPAATKTCEIPEFTYFEYGPWGAGYYAAKIASKMNMQTNK